jgi:lysophospholipase L1-like esterase
VSIPSRAFTTRGRRALLALGAILAADAAPALDVRYLAFGDSITAGFSFDEECECEVFTCRQACGYPRRLKRLLAAVGVDAGVINEGMGGEKTAEGVTRIDRLLGPGYDALLLMEGTNDVSQSLYSPETTQFNLSEMARKAAVKGVETIHATLIPRSPQARHDPDNVLNAQLAGRIRDLAFNGDRRLVDPFEVFAATPDLFDKLYANGVADPVGHPNARGFDLLAQVFFNALREIDDVPPVVGLVEPSYGALSVGPRSPVRVRLYDFGVGLDPSASTLSLNGEPVAIQSTGGSHWQDLVFHPADSLPAEVTVRVAGSDLAANAMDREVSRFTVEEDAGVGPCVADLTTLCIDRQLGDARFQLTLAWETALNGGQSGDAEAIPLASIGLRRGGLFSFFDRDNPEVLVKVLDGCALNGSFWVFVAPTTALGYTLRVVDTLAALQGAEHSQYEFVATNPDGIAAPPVSATAALPTCDYVAAPLAAGHAP